MDKFFSLGKVEVVPDPEGKFDELRNKYFSESEYGFLEDGASWVSPHSTTISLEGEFSADELARWAMLMREYIAWRKEVGLSA